MALIGALSATLSLGACGRKSGLDLPPTAAAAAAAPAPAAQSSNILTSPIARPERPKPTVVPNRELPIDKLLN